MAFLITVKDYAKAKNCLVRTVQIQILKNHCLPNVKHIHKLSNSFTVLEVEETLFKQITALRIP
jgi:hypothetical protein